MSLLTSLMVSVVIGLEFTIASTSTSNVCNDSSSKLFPCVLTKASRIPLAVLIYLSQTPPKWLAVGGLLIQVIQSSRCICKYSFILLWFMSWKNFRNSLTAPTNLLPLSDLIRRMYPLLPINLCDVSKRESVSREWATSIWVARLQRHVNMTPSRFNSFCLLQITKGPNKSTPQ